MVDNTYAVRFNATAGDVGDLDAVVGADAIEQINWSAIRVRSVDAGTQRAGEWSELTVAYGVRLKQGRELRTMKGASNGN